nr:unnamed protein product [Spirometra erinaceieuropaei]
MPAIKQLAHQARRPRTKGGAVNVHSNDLLKEKEEVEQRISELDALLQAYLANEKKFLELANSKADAERQMLVLQGIKDAGPSCQREPTGRRRRSFSTNTLELDEHGGRKFVATDF